MYKQSMTTKKQILGPNCDRFFEVGVENGKEVEGRSQNGHSFSCIISEKNLLTVRKASIYPNFFELEQSGVRMGIIVWFP